MYIFFQKLIPKLLTPSILGSLASWVSGIWIFYQTKPGLHE